MLKNISKFGVGIAVVILFGGGLLYMVQYLRMRSSPDYKAMQYAKDLERQYASDTYGGTTPEETLQLFIAALKQGNTDLAAKYFVLDQQKQWRDDLAKIKEKGLLNDMIRDLERKKYRHDISSGQVNFDIANEKNEGILSILLGKGPNEKWKILEL